MTVLILPDNETPPVRALPTDNEFVMQFRIDQLEAAIKRIEGFLEIPERPENVDELYHAGLAGQLKGRMQMALNEISQLSIGEITR
ncbi:MAG: hypothetical protein AAFO74_12895 [Pseudomonadota bacterium]